MDQKMRVLYVSPEVSPFAKSGELADVAAALPKYLSLRGIDISLIIPKYRRPEIESSAPELVFAELPVPLGGKITKASIYRTEAGEYPVYFVDNPKYFWREKIYGPATGDYLDNDERFIFFNRAVLEFLLKAHLPVDVIHSNSWPAALIPVFLRTHYLKEPLFKEIATVLTVHNAGYQGEFPPESLALTEIDWNSFNSRELSYSKRFNFLKTGLIFSDVINTVSSAYKKEVQTKKHGFGLEKILRSRRNDFFSIRNGVDYELWNPENDPFLAANFSLRSLDGKKICKQDLAREFGFSLAPQTPVVALTSYLTRYKGFDLLLGAMDELVKMDLGMIVCGQGDEKYEKEFSRLKKKYPGKIAVRFEMEPWLAHKIVAGADIFLIPSLHEPCGLNQLYGFRYGTVPVVRATGGLKETVKSFDRKTLRGNGFVFKEYSSEALLRTLKEALDCYQEPPLWRKIMEEGLRQNFSWEIAAREYLELYERALKSHRRGRFGH